MVSDKAFIPGIIIAIGGIFSIVCAVCDFDFFMNDHRARFFVDIFGRQGARIFYMLLGVFLLFLGTIGILR